MHGDSLRRTGRSWLRLTSSVNVNVDEHVGVGGMCNYGVLADPSLSMLLVCYGSLSRLVNPLYAGLADPGYSSNICQFVSQSVTPSNLSSRLLVSTTADKATHLLSTLIRTCIPCLYNCPSASKNTTEIFNQPEVTYPPF